MRPLDTHPAAFEARFRAYRAMGAERRSALMLRMSGGARSLRMSSAPTAKQVRVLRIAAAGSFVAAVAVVWHLVVSIQHNARAPQWPTTQGTVVGSWVSTTHHAVPLVDDYSSASIEYSYFAGGTKHTNNVLSFYEDDSNASSANAFATAFAYAQTGTVTVHYDPDDPDTSCLVVGGPLRVRQVVEVGGLAFFLLALAALLVWVASPRRARSLPPER